MSINLKVLAGYVGQEPEMKKTTNGTSILSFSMATNDGWGDRKKTTWHNIKVWSKLAEAVCQWIHKGSYVVVVGTTETESWEDRDGNKKSRTIVTAKEIDVPKLGGDASRQESQQEAQQQQEEPKKDLFGKVPF